MVRLRGADSGPELLGERGRLRLQISYDGARWLPPAPHRCGNPLPLPPPSTVDDIKKKVVRAIAALPTATRDQTTFNHTRAPGPAGSKEVTYLLPRAEPAGEPNPVLWLDMGGNQVVQCSAWAIWTAAVALNTVCVQRQGRIGVADGLGRQQKIYLVVGTKI
ncbi:MAG: hypothetical protein LQ348_001623 [Seirophora lacunosa]|nr:MAG: hypothetical protein LQ348_001623 [Seirophora lacunosa]